MLLLDCVVNEKCCSFYVPTPEDLTLKSPHHLEFAIQGKKMLMPGGQPGLERGGGCWEHK